MSDDIHDIIARAERSPGNAVSIDPPDADSPPCECGDSYEDHPVIAFEGGRYSVCPDGMAAIRDVLNDSGYVYREADDEPDPDRARDEAMDRDPPEPFD